MDGFVGPMYRQAMFRIAIISCVFLGVMFLGAWGWYSYRLRNLAGCYGQCADGNKHCQEMCFKKGECPFGWKP